MGQAIALVANLKPATYLKAKAQEAKEKWNRSLEPWRTYKQQSSLMAEKLKPFKAEIDAFNKGIVENIPLIEETISAHGTPSRTSLMLARYMRIEAETMKEKAAEVFKSANPLFESINSYYAPRDYLLTKTFVSSLAGFSIAFVTGMTSFSTKPFETTAATTIASWLWNISTSVFLSSSWLSGRFDKYRKPWKDTWRQVQGIKEAKPSQIPDIARIDKD